MPITSEKVWRILQGAGVALARGPSGAAGRCRAMIAVPFEYEAPATVEEADPIAVRAGRPGPGAGRGAQPDSAHEAAPRPAGGADGHRARRRPALRARRRRSPGDRRPHHPRPGAGATPAIGERCPVLAETAGHIGDPQVRNRGTIGGALAHADPAADYPATVLALDAEIVAQGPRGRRTVPVRSSSPASSRTALAPDELLVEVRVPLLGPGAGGAYLKRPNRPRTTPWSASPPWCAWRGAGSPACGSA